MPAGRAGIQTFVAPVAEKPAWFARVWDRVAEEVAQGRQAFVVCAAIDADTGTDDDTAEEIVADGGESARTRWGVVQVADVRSRHPEFSSLRVVTQHGPKTGRPSCEASKGQYG